MEKLAQTQLFNHLIENGFVRSCMYWTPHHHKSLRSIFSQYSKTNKPGIPDFLYLEGETLIVFECKAKDLRRAERDLDIYRKMMSNDEAVNRVFFVSFVSPAEFRISDSCGKTIESRLYRNAFGLDLPAPSVDVTDLGKRIHAIHNYIRDHTKISNEDKPFFIAIILISLRKESFRLVWKQHESTRFVYDLLAENLVDFDLDISVFDFMRRSRCNQHFAHLIDQVAAVVDCCGTNTDLLSLFYSEFVRYNNTDGKSLGIVLTPDYICEIMVRMLDLQADDVVLDLCAGTGSFLWKTKGVRKTIGCEYQTKLFQLLKCNKILRDRVDMELISDDCFSHSFECTKSVINPPFGQSDRSELQFVLKQLQSMSDNGLAVSILPIARITAPSAARQDIMSQSQVMCIIVLSEKVFYPAASVQCVILLLRRKAGGHDPTTPTKIIDFRNDGHILRRGRGRIRAVDYDAVHDMFWKDYDDPGIHHITLTQGNWLADFYKTIPNEISPIDLKWRMAQAGLNTFHISLLNTTHHGGTTRTMSRFAIRDLFSVHKKPPVRFVGDDRPFILEISARKYDNGVNDILPRESVNDDRIFSGGQIVLVTQGDGAAGMAFYQSEPFIISSSTVVLCPQPNVWGSMDSRIGHYVAMEISKFKQIYGRGYGWNLARILSDEIFMPVIPNTSKIDADWIRSLYD